MSASKDRKGVTNVQPLSEVQVRLPPIRDPPKRAAELNAADLAAKEREPKSAQFAVDVDDDLDCLCKDCCPDCCDPAKNTCVIL